MAGVDGIAIYGLGVSQIRSGSWQRRNTRLFNSLT